MKNTDATKFLVQLLQQQIASSLPDLFAGKRGNGGGGLQVVIHNNTPAAVTAREGVDRFDQKQLEITIDQMVATSLMHGRQTSGVMRSLFGLSPNLSGR